MPQTLTRILPKSVHKFLSNLAARYRPDQQTDKRIDPVIHYVRCLRRYIH